MFKLTRHRLLKIAVSVLLSFTFVCVSSVQPALAFISSTDQYAVDNIDGIIADVPTGERWIQHLEEDLLPFWTMDEALGKPLGNYPTYRCNDGSLYSWRKPCPELENADSSIVKLDREYIRAKSRQIFAYGVAYHLTGKNEYLKWAKEGVMS